MIFMKKHPIRCENANPKSKCVCRCGGRLHGIAHEHTEDIPGLRSVNEHIGGEIGEVIKEYNNRPFVCSCGKTFLLSFYAYPHDRGLEDSEKKKWWLFSECTNCHRQWNWDKIQVRYL